MTDARMYEEIKRAFEDFLIPELRAIREDLRRIGEHLRRMIDKPIGAPHTMTADTLRAEMLSIKGDLLSEIRRLDARIDGVDRELRAARPPSASAVRRARRAASSH